MYILSINGSPRRGGNTDILLDKFIEATVARGAKTERILLAGLKFSPCQECDKARDDGTCIIEDDMQPLYEKIKEADAIVLASPIFFGSLSAQTKMMVDRFQCLWRVKNILKKDVFKKKRNGYFICVEASQKEEFFKNARSIVKNLFATINVDYKEELFCPGVEGKGDILNYPHFLKEAFELGEKVVSEHKL